MLAWRCAGKHARIHGRGCAFGLDTPRRLLLYSPRRIFFHGDRGMADIAASNRSVNASDAGLIVQGSLILLSAVVALLGYSVQANLKKKERRAEIEENHRDYLRKAELDLLRTKLRTFVGPATQLALCAWNCMWRNCFVANSIGDMGAREASGAGAPLVNLNSLAGGDRVHNYWNNPPEKGGMGFSFFPGMMKGTFNGVLSFVGPDVEKEISAAPESPLARHYFKFCRRVVKRYCAPLRDMLLQHCQTLDIRHSAAEFKDEFPVLKSAGWLRNLLYIDLIEWVNCFEEIFVEWDAGNYDVVYPPEVAYPLQLTRLMTNQLTEIREKETELGTAQHKVLAGASEEDRIKKMETSSGTTGKSTDAPAKEAPAKGKYVAAGGVAGAVGAAVLSTVVSES